MCARSRSFSCVYSYPPELRAVAHWISRGSGRMEKNRPCEGILTESRTGDRWRVSYAKKCASIDDTEKPKVQTKNLDTADEKQDDLSKPDGGTNDGQDEALDEV